MNYNTPQACRARRRGLQARDPAFYAYVTSPENEPDCPPPYPVPASCPYLPHGKLAYTYSPLSRKELETQLRRLHAPYCVVLRPHNREVCFMDREEFQDYTTDLQYWAKALKLKFGYPVVFAYCEDRCLCGREPACRFHAAQVAAQNRNYDRLLERGSSEEAERVIEFTYREILSLRHREVLTKWVTAQDPTLTYKPIRQSSLANQFGITERHVNRILRIAKEAESSIFAQLKAFRNRRKSKPPRQNNPL